MNGGKPVLFEQGARSRVVLISALLLTMSLGPTGGALHAHGAPIEQQQAPADAQALRQQADDARRAGDALLREGNAQAALEQYTRVLALSRQAANRGTEWLALNGLGFASSSLRQFAQAADYHGQALAITRELTNRGGERSALGGLSNAYNGLARFPEALDTAQQALSIARELGDREAERSLLLALARADAGLARHDEALDAAAQALAIAREQGNGSAERTALSATGDAYTRLGRPADAIASYQQALQLARSLGDHPGERSALSGLGWSYYALGEFTDALQSHQQSLGVTRESGDRAGQMAALHGVATVLRRVGDYDRAVAMHQQSLEIARELDDRAAESTALSGLGTTRTQQGLYAEAIQLHEEALAIVRATGDRRSQALFLTAAAFAYFRLAQYDRALDYYEQSLTLAREVGDRGAEAIALQGIGFTSGRIGNEGRRAAVLQESLNIARAGGLRWAEWQALSNIGSAYVAQGQMAEALDALVEALAIAKEMNDLEAQHNTLAALAGAYQRQGQYDLALASHREALIYARQLGIPAREAQSLSGMAQTLVSLNDLTGGMDALRQAIVVRESERSAARLEEFKASLAEDDAMLYGRAAALALRLRRDDDAFDLTERARARAFLDQLGNAHLEPTRAADPQLLRAEEALRAEISSLDERLRRAREVPIAQQDASQARALTNDLASAQQRYSDLLTQLKLRDPESASLVGVTPLTVSEVQRLLDADTTLIAYFILPSTLPQGTALAFVVTRDRFETVRLAVREQELTAAIQQFRSFSSPDEAAGLLAQLGDWLVAPLADRLTTPVVGIVPHGSLHYLPFAALPDGAALLGETHTLFALPSASTLPFVQQKRKASPDRVLALAQSQPAGFPALRYADVEAESIARLYDGTALTGSGATETAFKAQAGQAPIVHVAAHAELNEHAPLFSRILLAPDGQNDGSLTVQEVYGLDLARADLVVLSACETQLGAQSRGDELVGLNRAFIYAGAPTVVASLWSVDDEATAVLMTAFYRQLRQGASKAAALQAAQAETRARYPHPYYWAAFVLTGDPGIVTAGAR